MGGEGSALHYPLTRKLFRQRVSERSYTQWQCRAGHTGYHKFKMAVNWTGVAKTKPVPALGSAVGCRRVTSLSLVSGLQSKAEGTRREKREEKLGSETK